MEIAAVKGSCFHIAKSGRELFMQTREVEQDFVLTKMLEYG